MPSDLLDRLGRRRRRACAFEPLERRVLLSTYTVSNLNDSGPGSLRDAVAQANDHAGADTIDFASDLNDGISVSTITLTSGRITITDDLTINGLGIPSLAVSGNHAGGVFLVTHRPEELERRVFSVQITGLTIRDASGDQSAVTDYDPSDLYPNAIDLTFSNCAFVGNTFPGTFPAERGGVILNAAHLQLINCAIDDNNTTAIDNEVFGDTIVTGCTISNNVDGIRSESGAVSISDTTLFGNGGAVFGGDLSARIEVTHCVITANGGGVGISGGDLTVTDCTVTANQVGISAVCEPVRVIGCTVTGNQIGLFAGSDGGLLIYNSTIANNDGGGIQAQDGNVFITNSTITGNVAQPGSGAGIDFRLESGRGGLEINNTIVAGNHDVAGAASDILSRGSNVHPVGPTLGANNLIGSGGSGGLINGQDGNIVGVDDPKLAPLANYGGLTQTMPPLPGSLAINAGSNALAVGPPEIGNQFPPVYTPLAADQRGFYRIAHGKVDIGAVEFGSTPLLPGDANGDRTVNFADLLILAQHYGYGAFLPRTGDFNNDGSVGFDDLLLLAENYGRSVIDSARI